jgi:tight adherence protein B
MNPIIIIGAVSIIVIFLVTVILVKRNNDAQHNRRMKIIRGHNADFLQKSFDPNRKRKDDLSQKLKEKSEAAKNNKVTMRQQLEQAGLKMSPKKFVLVFAILSIVFVFFGISVFKWQSFVAICFGFAFFFGGQRIFIRNRIKSRQKKFLSEFADALEAMVRLLKAGMPVTEAIRMSSQEFEGPVGEEMARMYSAQKVGVSLPDAALDAARRMPITEMQMFATGIAIQAQTGASLSDVLMNLASVIRARFRLRRKVQALSAEAKSSAAIIGALPFLVGGGMFLINPEFINPLLTTTTGKGLMIFCAVWMMSGILVMRAMINFKI